MTTTTDPSWSSFVWDELRDPRVVYRRIEEPLGVVGNFSAAMELASGEYVCFIGDDDGVNPEIVDAAAWAHSQGFDALLLTRPVDFWWPDIRHRYYGDSMAGKLEIGRFTGRISFPDPQEELIKCARGAGAGVLRPAKGLPWSGPAGVHG